MVARLYYLTHSLIPSRQANAIQVMKTCEALAKEDTEVTLFCRRKRVQAAEVFDHYGIRPCFNVRGLSLPRIPALTRIAHTLAMMARIIAAPRADVLYARDAFLLGALSRLPFLSPALALEVHRPPSGWLEARLQRWIVHSPRFRLLVVISEALEREYRRRFGAVLDGRVLLARDGADPRPASDAPQEVAKGPPLVGYVGSLSAGKGMEVVGRLAELRPALGFEVVGGSTRDIAGWRERITTENVTFQGFASPAKVPEVIDRFQVMLAPYQKRVLVGHKGVDVSAWMSPLKIFEYMAAGKPIIASDLPALREFLRDGENALLAPPNEPEVWARRIDQLVDDPGLRQRLGAQARRDFLESYSWRRRARCILDRLEEGEAV